MPAAEESPVTLPIRCSLDTAPSHVRNVAIADYLAKLQDATGGRITSEIFASGQLYPDLNVGKAPITNSTRMISRMVPTVMA